MDAQSIAIVISSIAAGVGSILAALGKMLHTINKNKKKQNEELKVIIRQETERTAANLETKTRESVALLKGKVDILSRKQEKLLDAFNIYVQGNGVNNDIKKLVKETIEEAKDIRYND